MSSFGNICFKKDFQKILTLKNYKILFQLKIHLFKITQKIKRIKTDVEMNVKKQLSEWSREYKNINNEVFSNVLKKTVRIITLQ